MYVRVKDHVLTRWPERVQGSQGSQGIQGQKCEIDKQRIERLFKNNMYSVLEPGHNGRLIVTVKDLVFVITKTSHCITVHTVYGHLKDYEQKCPDQNKAYECFEIYRWEKQLSKKQRR